MSVSTVAGCPAGYRLQKVTLQTVGESGSTVTVSTTKRPNAGWWHHERRLEGVVGDERTSVVSR